ncbi:branched-chain amino acid ABC transporter permease [Actinoplanes sp. ATCC 53533]|uniref:branched-chain amino acid ABC transporter permease n=1 Tax=Actinoplanes sp. ATCC 53533 TaxID=1288362 RepID=UPI000F790165|nr:branched-chain amino acid ABC transporter permease [Actinoplanes sp. ATCC 53533]RSM64037.1 branched-chain amino acid ABC transporter permease [Actinoplanes sp. ATCC 53533]
MGVTYAVTALDGVAFGLLMFVVGAGLMLIFGVMDVLNLAHGSLFLGGAYVGYLLGGSGLLDLAAATAAGAILGAGGGVALGLAMRPLVGHGHLEQALATLGVSFVAADAYTSGFGGAPLHVNPPDLLAGTVTLGRHGYPTYRLGFIIVAALLAVVLHLSITRSRHGVLLRATVADPAMAAATGINTRRVQTLAMAAGGALAVTAGVLGAPLLGPAPGVDTTVLVLSLIIVIIGGAGSIPGALIAALLVGQVQTVGVIAAPTAAPFALLGVLLIVLTIRNRAQPAAHA